MIEFESVVLDYPASDQREEPLRALDNLCLTVNPGEALAVIGPSGCGKSSMLRLATGLAAPTSGKVRIQGQALNKPRKETALILQDFGLLPWKTVYENAELGLLIHREPAADRKRKTCEALERVGLADFADSYPNQLSGGMQQRLALARAMAINADIVLMDEPLSALDALLREELQNTLLSLWQERGYTQILVTHSIEEAVFLGQRIIVMAPRPSRVVAQIENPEMGSISYRNDDLFFERCRAVRAALEGGAR